MPDAGAVDFDQLAWEAPAPGLRTKTVDRGGKKLRLVEFSADFVEPDWCVRGHAGLVLQGEIEGEGAGAVVRFRTGEGLFIAAGDSHRHRHHATIAAARLFLVEDL